MIATDDGYSIIYNKQSNNIQIGLPQTVQTATNTITKIADRKTDISDEQLAIILYFVKTIFINTDGYPINFADLTDEGD